MGTTIPHDSLVFKFQHGVVHMIEKLARERGIPADLVIERAALIIASEAVAAIERYKAFGGAAVEVVPEPEPEAPAEG